MILSDRFNGFFLVPTPDSWNYNFKGIRFQAENKYILEAGIPLEFYNEIHRPDHILGFKKNKDPEQAIDVQDY